MSVFNKSPKKGNGTAVEELALSSARERKIALETEFRERFSAQAVADCVLLGTQINERERADLEGQIRTCVDEIEGLLALRDKRLAEQRVEKLAKMQSDKDELDQKRGALIKRADAMRIESDSLDHEIRTNFAATQQLQRAIAAAEAAQQVPR